MFGILQVPSTDLKEIFVQNKISEIIKKYL